MSSTRQIIHSEESAKLFWFLVQAQKFNSASYSDEEEEELEEEGLFETPLDSIEPYILFRDSFFRKTS